MLGAGPADSQDFSERSKMKIALYVLAAIGALAVIAILGMLLMHGTMMSGMM